MRLLSGIGIVLSLALSFASCGGPAYQPGVYAMDITYLRDDWPGGQDGRKSHAIWRLEKDGEDYSLYVQDTDFMYKGHEDGGHLYFRRQSGGSGCFYNDLQLKIWQTDDKTIDAQGEIITKIDCSGVLLKVEIEAIGRLLEEL